LHRDSRPPTPTSCAYPLLPANDQALTLIYKDFTQTACPVPASPPKDLCHIRQIHNIPIPIPSPLPTLPTPPACTPDTCFLQGRSGDRQLSSEEFLRPREPLCLAPPLQTSIQTCLPIPHVSTRHLALTRNSGVRIESWMQGVATVSPTHGNRQEHMQRCIPPRGIVWSTDEPPLRNLSSSYASPRVLIQFDTSHTHFRPRQLCSCSLGGRCRHAERPQRRGRRLTGDGQHF
jgi:hypothetical protein